jgi:hypothetical protein
MDWNVVEAFSMHLNPAGMGVPDAASEHHQVVATILIISSSRDAASRDINRAILTHIARSIARVYDARMLPRPKIAACLLRSRSGCRLDVTVECSDIVDQCNLR